MHRINLFNPQLHFYLVSWLEIFCLVFYHTSVKAQDSFLICQQYFTMDSTMDNTIFEQQMLVSRETKKRLQQALRLFAKDLGIKDKVLLFSPLLPQLRHQETLFSRTPMQIMLAESPYRVSPKRKKKQRNAIRSFESSEKAVQKKSDEISEKAVQKKADEISFEQRQGSNQLSKLVQNPMEKRYYKSRMGKQQITVITKDPLKREEQQSIIRKGHNSNERGPILLKPGQNSLRHGRSK